MGIQTAGWRARAAGGVTLGLLVPLLGVATPAGSAVAAPARQLDRQVATLTQSVAGYPQSPEAGRQIKRAAVKIVHRRSAPGVHLNVDTVLRGAPTRNPDSELALFASRFDGNTCPINPNQPMASRNVWAADGATVPSVGATRAKPSPLWNCVVVMLRNVDNPATIYDVKVGSLTNKFVTPRLKVGAVGMLGRNQKQLQVIRRVTQVHDVTVRNNGGLAATKVVVVGIGKGMRVRRTPVGRLEPGQAKTVRVPITLAGPHARTKVRLVVRGSGRQAQRVLPVRRVKAPAAPRVGRWKGGGNTFSFRVKKRAVVGFRGVNMRMTCSPVGGFPTYRNVSLSFRRTPIPRHGFIDATQRYRKGSAWFTASLRGRVVGGRLVAGRFSYHTAGACSVIEHFAARRVSR